VVQTRKHNLPMGLMCLACGLRRLTTQVMFASVTISWSELFKLPETGDAAKYLLGNLSDFIPAGQVGTNAVAYDELPSLDKWMLGRLSIVLNEVDATTDEFQFNPATQALLNSSADLSNFYLDVAKDRLYISSIDDPRRRSCQTVLHAVLLGLAKSVAPILPHLAKDMAKSSFEPETNSVLKEGGLNN
jgi:isoleucyl-tRNA synthetase